jgi:hypothetical protein
MASVIFDNTADYIETPGGMGKFIEYDGATKTVTVELDYSCRAIYPANVCYVKESDGNLDRKI